MERSNKQLKRSHQHSTRNDRPLKQNGRQVKQHIISLRISAVEYASLHEAMKGLQFKRVSDLMREAFKLLQAPPASS